MDPYTKSVLELFCCSNGISVIRESHQKGAIKITEIKRTVVYHQVLIFNMKSLRTRKQKRVEKKRYKKEQKNM